MDFVTPDQLAAYDQLLAGRAAQLDDLIDVCRELRATRPQEIVTAGTAHYLRHDLTPTLCAELLACAIDRLAHHPHIDHPPQETIDT